VPAVDDCRTPPHTATQRRQVLGVPPEGASAVRMAVQPIVDWLQEAESDGSSEEDSDE
jgi:hypothetical protein